MRESICSTSDIRSLPSLLTEDSQEGLGLSIVELGREIFLFVKHSRHPRNL